MALKLWTVIWLTTSLLVTLISAQEYDVSKEDEDDGTANIEEMLASVETPAACPTKEELDNESGYPIVHQINSTAVSVEWSNLWTSLTWPSDCVEQFQIVIDENNQIELEPSDITEAEQIIEVPTCQPLNIELKVKVENSDDWSSSFLITSKNMTYKAPQFTEDAKIEVDYAMNEFNTDVLDLRRIKIKGSFFDIVEDFECRRVEKIELMVSKHNDKDWFIHDTFKSVQELDKIVDGLDDFCSSYDISFKLTGTEGTEPAEKVLATLEPIKDKSDLLNEAKETGFEVNFKTKAGPLELYAKTNTSVSVQWNKDANVGECFEGYFFTIYDKDYTKVRDQLVPSSELSAKFEGLEPCAKYYISAQYYLGVDGEDQPIFHGGESTFLEVRTLPATSSAFELRNVQAFNQRNSLLFVWDQADLGECISANELRVSLCRKYLERGTCYQVKEGKKGEFRQIKGSTKHYVRFRHLSPCTTYQVFVENAYVKPEVIEIDEIGAEYDISAENAEYEQDITDGSIIDIDSPIQRSWSVWYAITTNEGSPSSPMDFKAIDANETAVKLHWKVNPCIKSGYFLGASLSSGLYGQVGSKYISVVSNSEESDDLTNPKVLELSTFSHEGSGDNLEDDDDNDALEEDDSDDDLDEGSGSGDTILSNDYFLEYEEEEEMSGSGDDSSSMFENEDTTEEYVEGVFDNLDPCTSYNFSTSKLGENDNNNFAHTEASTLCPENVTTTVEPTTSSETITEIDPIEAISNVTLTQNTTKGEGTIITLNWESDPSVKVLFEVYEGDEFFASREIEPPTFFLNFPSCQKYDISLKAVFPNDSSITMWKESIETVINADDDFELTDFYLTIHADETEGQASVNWKHTLGCVESYALLVKEEGVENPKQGEMMIPSPKKGEEISVDLNMLPGLLDLKNCNKYSLSVFPNSFPGRGEDDPNAGKWHQGLSNNFTYSLTDGKTPNPIKMSEAVTFVYDESSLTLTWDEPFICNPIDLKIIKKPYLYKNHSHHEHIVLETKDYQVGDPVDITDLSACMSYRWEIMSSEELIHVQDFKTLDDGNALEPFTDHEVIVWKDDEDFEKVALEWSDRCQSSYTLDVCQFPYGCSDSQKESFHFRTFDVQQFNSSVYPKETVTDLLPCAFYTFEISNHDRSFLFYNGSFVTTFSDEDFDLNLVDFSVNQAGMALNASWIHVHPCISSYAVTLIDASSKNVLKETNVEAPTIIDRFSKTLVYVYFDEDLNQCNSYDIIIKPLFNVTEDAKPLPEDDKRTFKHTELLFNGPIAPDHFQVQKEYDDVSVTLEWSHLSCYDFYLLTAFKDKNESLIMNRTIEGQKDAKTMMEQIKDLTPCSTYTFLLYSGTEKEISKDHVGLVHFTRHADFIEMEAFADYHEIAVDVRLHGIDCVSHYKLFLCDDQQQCQDVNVEVRGNVTFKDLEDGHSFSYQLMGYDDEDVETYVSETFSIKTPLNVTATFQVSSVTNNSVILDFHSSIFDKFAKDDLEPFTVLASCHDSVNDIHVVEQASNIRSLTLKGLKAFTTYTCTGQFQYIEFYDIETIEFTSGQGVPSKPEKLTIDKISDETAVLEWGEPEILNGIVKEYKIEVIKTCHEENDICPDHPCEEESFEYITPKDILDLEKLVPWTVYKIRVAARTDHPDFGPFSEELRFKTLEGKPNEPEILKTSQGKKGGLVIEFEYPCPLTGKTTFQAHYQASVANLTLKNVTSVKHRPLTIELLGLEGGHYYDVWIEACVDKECAKSKSQSRHIQCEHRCSDGTCIHKLAKCNYIRECPDGSDEIDCPCDPPLYYRCRNNYCIPSWRQCDGVNDCNDMSDEDSCPSCIAAHQFRCRESGECFLRNETVCDKRVDCRDGSDESGCAYWRESCWPEKFRCLNNKCVDMKHRCDRIWDCDGGEDELSCDNGCPNGGQFACRNKDCISMSRYCDGVADCSDGSDETPECRCHKSGQFACKRGGKCISRTSVCDGISDCPDQSDESNCRHIRNNTLSKVEKVVTSHQEANILYQEIEAPKLETANLVETPRFQVKVYPKTQSVYKNSDVVIQCRDEGFSRSEVKWVRLDGGPMPKHTRQRKGRLEIRRIGLHEGGLYVCQAVGHSNDKGGEEIAQVEVMKLHTTHKYSHVRNLIF